MLARTWRKRNIPPLLVGLQTGTTTLEISLVVLRKLKIILLEDPAILLLDICPKHALPYHKDMCSTMFIAVLFIIARNWNQPRRSSTKEWTQKMWFIYVVEYYSDIKNECIVHFSGKWTELENIIQSEVTQTQKDMHGMYSLTRRYLSKKKSVWDFVLGSNDFLNFLSFCCSVSFHI